MKGSGGRCPAFAVWRAVRIHWGLASCGLPDSILIGFRARREPRRSAFWARCASGFDAACLLASLASCGLAADQRTEARLMVSEVREVNASCQEQRPLHPPFTFSDFCRKPRCSCVSRHMAGHSLSDPFSGAETFWFRMRHRSLKFSAQSTHRTEIKGIFGPLNGHERPITGQVPRLGYAKIPRKLWTVASY